MHFYSCSTPQPGVEEGRLPRQPEEEEDRTFRWLAKAAGTGALPEDGCPLPGVVRTGTLDSPRGPFTPDEEMAEPGKY